MATTVRVLELKVNPKTKESTKTVVFGPERLADDFSSDDLPKEYQYPNLHISYWVQVRRKGRWETEYKLNEDIESYSEPESKDSDIFENTDQIWVDEDDPVDNW